MTRYLRPGGFCKTGRHLLAERDIGPGGCRPCHREEMRARRGGLRYECDFCGEPGGRDRLCRVHAPEAALLTYLYRALEQERRPGFQMPVATCPDGHPFDASNTQVVIDRRQRRVLRFCRACDRARRGPRYEATKAAIARLIVQQRAA